MSKNYAEQPYNQIRRADRAVDDEQWIKEFLGQAPFGALATIYNDQPFINTNLFAYDESKHIIYTHTARVGRTAANIAANNKVCFSISEMGRLLPADEALEFSVEYAGVAVFGTIAVIDNDEEAEYGLQLLLDKYCPHLKPGRDYRGITPEELKRTAVYRIDIKQWSGKRKQVEDDFPGAFYYNQSQTQNKV